jgi:SAM-dependent methyltransferase
VGIQIFIARPSLTASKPRRKLRYDTAVVEQYFRSLYQRTMREAYATAHDAIGAQIAAGAAVLDCGAGRGATFDILAAGHGLDPARYRGVEWDAASAAAARARGLDVVEGDLNRTLPLADASMRCIYGLSVLEHLLNPCRFLVECRRVLEPGGTLVLLTPNISTYFTAVQILLGRMPSSGPHPDSNSLVKSQEIFKVSSESVQPDTETDTPVHRHLVVFSFRVLGRYLRMLGFEDIRGRGFGLYPFPNFAQPLLEKIDPWHCHQMVYTARKASA